MKTILKIVVGIILAITIIAVGAMFLFGSAVNEVSKGIDKDQEQYGMTSTEFKEVKTGISYKDFVQEYGKPDPERTQESESSGYKNVTVYYYVEGGDMLDMYQFSFTNGKLDSKAKW